MCAQAFMCSSAEGTLSVVKYTHHVISGVAARACVLELLPETGVFYQKNCPEQGLLLFSPVRLSATPWSARQASLSITNSQSLLKLMSIESVMPSSHLILCLPRLLPPSIFPSIRGFSTSGGQSIGGSASASVLSMNIQD